MTNWSTGEHCSIRALLLPLPVRDDKARELAVIGQFDPLSPLTLY